LHRPLPVTTAIVIAERPGAEERLHDLFAMLIDANIVVTVVAEPQDATTQLIMADATELPCVLIDASHVDPDDSAAMAGLLGAIRAVTAVPDMAPIALAPSPRSDLVIRAFRAGAGDFLDLDADTDAHVTRILQRVADTYQDRLEQKKHVRTLKSMLEDFLKDLVKTERRSLDLEQKLAPRVHGQPDRRPTVLIIDQDATIVDELAARLGDAGLATVTAHSGEQAVERARSMTAQDHAIDLALVDARLPAMNALETIAALRELVPQLSAMLMTECSDSEAAISIENLDVVGHVLKPLDDMPGLIKRIQEQAAHTMNSAREYRYLDRIKQRHEKLLLRYRQLALDLDRL
jgi:DNA-binding NarL/FixJ family response regulator